MPLYSWFRNLSRHLFLFAFGASVLGGVGMAALQRRQISIRAAQLAVALLAVVMVLGAVLIWKVPGAFPLEGPHGEPGPGPLSFLSVGVWIQLGLVIVVAAITARLVHAPSPGMIVLLMAVLVGDALSALPYNIKRDGIEFYALGADNTGPSVHAVAIGRLLDTTQGRALAAGGTQVDDVLPATFARAWRIPIAGGCGAMLIDRTSRMANMGTNGEIRPAVLADTNSALDLLAVRYLIVNREQLDDPVRRHWLYKKAIGGARRCTSRHRGRRTAAAIRTSTARPM